MSSNYNDLPTGNITVSINIDDFTFNATSARLKSDQAIALAFDILQRIESLEDDLDCFAQRETNWLSYQVFS